MPTYKTKLKKRRSFRTHLIQHNQKARLQNKINYLLFRAKSDEGEPLTKTKMFTIIILENKEHNFHFLKNETEFNVKGKWHSKRSKLFEENNAEITILYLDNEQGSVTRKLDKYFKQYNKKYVGEEVLYTTTTPIEKTSLNLQGYR